MIEFLLAYVLGVASALLAWRFMKWRRWI